MGSELRCLASHERGLQKSQDGTASPPHIVLLYTQEWLSAVSRVQEEEKERISKFVFSRDAKLALVRGGGGGGKTIHPVNPLISQKGLGSRLSY